MKLNRLSIKTKLLFLVLLISSIFVFSSFFIKSANNKVAENFNQFYNHTFSVTISFENVKSAQTDIMLNIRGGLQISYLLGLMKQVDGYVTGVNSSISQTPVLIKQLKNEFSGDMAQIDKLENLINTFQDKSQIFIKAMQVSDNNKAPYPRICCFP